MNQRVSFLLILSHRLLKKGERCVCFRPVRDLFPLFLKKRKNSSSRIEKLLLCCPGNFLKQKHLVSQNRKIPQLFCFPNRKLNLENCLTLQFFPFWKTASKLQLLSPCFALRKNCFHTHSSTFEHVGDRLSSALFSCLLFDLKPQIAPFDVRVIILRVRKPSTYPSASYNSADLLFFSLKNLTTSNL